MTCVIGLKHAGRVYIGADGQGTAGKYSKDFMQGKKVFRNGQYVIGYTTSFRMGQVLEFDFEPPIYKDSDGDLLRFMVKSFIPVLRDCLKSAGFSQKESDRESGGNFLVGIGNRLFEVESDYQVFESSRGYMATGSGMLVALGSLYTTKSMPMSAEDKMNFALEAAAENIPGVGGINTILAVDSGLVLC